ncbi:MAG: hypothetical protein JRH08_11590 [Deltaproteobacteria bacterium]|nr:hypothetical protein [Deltaproteobacteria bacterium]
MEVKMKSQMAKKKCPKGQKECGRFAEGWFCPFAPFAIMDEREFKADCPDAPESIWRTFLRLKERTERSASHP